MKDLKRYLQEIKVNTDNKLKQIFPENIEVGSPEETYRAMRYMIFLGDGGKRIRPAITLAACEACGGDTNKAWPYALAVEQIHAYTLILDDIQDKSSFRRNSETCHMKYGFNAAILAAERLYERGLRVYHRAPQQYLNSIYDLLDILHRGQAADLAAESWEKDNNTLENLQFIHSGKTSALIQLSVLGGAIAADADESKQNALFKYGYYVGLAFQARDDILSITSTPEKLGKPVGSDVDENKLTYPNILGNLDQAQEEAESLASRALEHLCSAIPNNSNFLINLAEYSVKREK